MPRAASILIATVALTAFALALASSAEARVARPPLPSPFPAIIDSECPGLPEAGCYLGAGTADVNGTVYAHGAVFGSGDRYRTLHELGHAFDETMMDAGERQRFAWLLGREYEVWTYSYTDEHDRLIQSPGALAETFADAYANCRMGHERGPNRIWEAGYDYYPDASTHRQVCGMIARAGRDAGSSVAANGSR